MKKYIIYIICCMCLNSCYHLIKEYNESKEEVNQDDVFIEEDDDELGDYYTPLIKYLYYSNGGLIAFYDDGYVCYCPRCDLSKSNVKALMTTIPEDGYNDSYEENNDHLELSDGEKIYFSEYGWAMIRYEWMEEIN